MGTNALDYYIPKGRWYCVEELDADGEPTGDSWVFYNKKEANRFAKEIGGRVVNKA